jgi:hypothetical protein
MDWLFPEGRVADTKIPLFLAASFCFFNYFFERVR